MNLIPWLTILFGLVVLTTSIPLLRRKVPMNRFYGIRVPAAFRSDADWYEINEFGGRELILWSLVVIASGAIGLFVPRNLLTPYVWIDLWLTTSAMAIALLRTLIWSKKRLS